MADRSPVVVAREEARQVLTREATKDESCLLVWCHPPGTIVFCRCTLQNPGVAIKRSAQIVAVVI